VLIDGSRDVIAFKPVLALSLQFLRKQTFRLFDQPVDSLPDWPLMAMRLIAISMRIARLSDGSARYCSTACRIDDQGAGRFRNNF
jgi:hypothetical protein